MVVGFFSILLIQITWDLLDATAVLPKIPARVGEFPYQALIIQCKTTTSCGYCGGSVISSRLALTAAHCVTAKKNVHVHLGAHKFDQVNETGRVNLQCDKNNIFRHTGFDPNTLEHDLAIVKFPYSIKFTDRIQPVQMPLDIKDSLEGKRCVISGWGKKGDDEGLTPILQKQVLTMISNERCSSFYKTDVFDTDICGEGRIIFRLIRAT